MYKNKILPKRISISKTPTEWDLINSNLKNHNRKDLNTYLRAEIYKLMKQKCPESAVTAACEEQVVKRHYLTEDSYRVLKLASIKLKKPISTIIDQIIIAPLLRNK